MEWEPPNLQSNKNWFRANGGCRFWSRRLLIEYYPELAARAAALVPALTLALIRSLLMQL